MDDCILRLIQLYDRNPNALSKEAVGSAFCKTSRSAQNGSKLRRLFAEEIVKAGLRDGLSGRDYIQRHTLGLAQCTRSHHCGLWELQPATTAVQDQAKRKTHLLLNRFTHGEFGEAAAWMDKMDGKRWRDIKYLVDQRVRGVLDEQKGIQTPAMSG